MKRILRTQLLASLAATGLACLAAAPVAAQETTIRLAWYMPPHTATADQGAAIARNIEAMSNGSIKVQAYPSGSLLKQSNMAKGLANNTANMGIMGMHWWSKYEPALEWDTIPFLVDDAGALLEKLHGRLGRDVNALLNKHGVQIVGWGFYGYAKSYVNTKRPVRVPGDLAGLKMRSEGRLSALFLKAYGATPVGMDSSEVYTAMQRGTLDGGVSGLSTIISRKWYEVGRYITAIRYVPLVYPVQVNLRWWRGLSEAQRDLITRAVAASEDQAVAAIEEEFVRSMDIAIKYGDRVYRPTEEELAKWKQQAGTLARTNYLEHTGEAGRRILDDLGAAGGQ